MYDSELQSRFAASTLDAMQGYMSASNAASAAAMGNILDFWSSTAKAFASGGLRPAESAMPSWPQPWPQTWPQAWPQMANRDAAYMQPWDVWMSMTPFGRPPVVLQMAYAMMAFGVPREVAMPTAEANLAAIDAAETAAKPFKDAFSTYRSDGGHATAQIKYAMTAAMMSPLMLATATWPWTQGLRSQGF